MLNLYTSKTQCENVTFATEYDYISKKVAYKYFAKINRKRLQRKLKKNNTKTYVVIKTKIVEKDSINIKLKKLKKLSKNYAL